MVEIGEGEEALRAWHRAGENIYVSENHSPPPSPLIRYQTTTSKERGDSADVAVQGVDGIKGGDADGDADLLLLTVFGIGRRRGKIER
ncbi:unnamed protein product [Linum trigynum]|uniref:Uncharacterized protein n=1 Tax=Linum trigynum TaxID=586398 RepID=A0AAV2E7D8_9ROSI